MKEYTIIANCNLTSILVDDREHTEEILKSDSYQTFIKELIKHMLGVDDLDITGVKVFVRDLEDKKDEE